jgi:hypothetical protein
MILTGTVEAQPRAGHRDTHAATTRWMAVCRRAAAVDKLATSQGTDTRHDKMDGRMPQETSKVKISVQPSR